jgi:DNA invertase Pin-like site-specific DNA recombinase
MANVGYIRVSSISQNSERQLAGIELDKFFEDTVSGRNLSRPGLKQCFEYLREGDTLYVHSIDRLARNLSDLQCTIENLTSKGITIKFVKENLEFSPDNLVHPLQKMVFQIMGAFAEFERNLIKERQLEGISVAISKGKKFGRPPKCTQAQKNEIISRIIHGDTTSDIARDMNVSTSYVQKLYKNSR